MTVKGKMYLRETTQETTGWDEELTSEYMKQWNEWTNSLGSLKEVKMARCYSSQLHVSSNATKSEIHVFSDASEKVIGSVSYLKT